MPKLHKVTIQKVESVRNQSTYYTIDFSTGRGMSPQIIAQVYNYDWALDIGEFVANHYQAELVDKTGDVK
ncbi:MAG: hypothetical protein ACYSW3_02030 [Planctomycetota bacterium]|jgi:hypothetical protein